MFWGDCFVLLLCVNHSFLKHHNEDHVCKITVVGLLLLTSASETGFGFCSMFTWLCVNLLISHIYMIMQNKLCTSQGLTFFFLFASLSLLISILSHFYFCLFCMCALLLVLKSQTLSIRLCTLDFKTCLFPFVLFNCLSCRVKH